MGCVGCKHPCHTPLEAFHTGCVAQFFSWETLSYAALWCYNTRKVFSCQILLLLRRAGCGQHKEDPRSSSRMAAVAAARAAVTRTLLQQGSEVVEAERRQEKVESQERRETIGSGHRRRSRELLCIKGKETP